MRVNPDLSTSHHSRPDSKNSSQDQGLPTQPRVPVRDVPQVLGSNHLNAFHEAVTSSRGRRKGLTKYGLFHEQGQTHLPIAFDLRRLKFILLKTLVDIEFIVFFSRG